MKFSVGDNIMKETVKCENSYSCLGGDMRCMCEVEDNIINRIIYVKPPVNLICKYKISFGYGHVCNCPVRREIHNIYRV